MALARTNTDHRMAVYAGTFDPLTLGHEDIVLRASRLFDELILAVAFAHHKKTLLSLQEREHLAQLAFADYANVRVTTFSGLLCDFVRATQASTLVRGVRSGKDMDYELQLAALNQHLMPEVQTCFLASAPVYQCISSTYVREIAKLGGEVSAFVNPQVEKSLRICLHNAKGNTKQQKV